ASELRTGHPAVGQRPPPLHKERPPLEQQLRNHPPPLELYKQQLVQREHMSEEEIVEQANRVDAILNDEFAASKEYVPSTRDWLAAYWSGFKSPEQLSRIRNTG
ncbi:unnamed protein product, partial [Closterium sp. NIES-53]